MNYRQQESRKLIDLTLEGDTKAADELEYRISMIEFQRDVVESYAEKLNDELLEINWGEYGG